MKVVILGGGFGTRLERDMKNDQSGTYQHLHGVPKSLLPVGGIPLLTHWMRMFQKLDIIDHVYVEANDVFYDQFKEWSLQWPGYVSVVNDHTTTNETRLGAVGAIAFAVNYFKIENSDVIVVAGDTLFYEDFDLSKMITKFLSLKSVNSSSSLVTVYECNVEDIVKRGIVEIDEMNGQVTSFLEKPSLEMTSSRLACPCFYILSSAAVIEADKFLKEMEDSPLHEKDATGKYLSYLYKRLPVFTYEISGRFDVGGLPSYIECLKYFNKP